MEKSFLQLTRNSISPCLPPWWARTGHLQTILGHLLDSPDFSEKGEVFTIPLESKDEQIHSTYIKGEIDKVVYLFHGLGGSAEATYMKRTALIAKKLGYHIFINNHRGCGKGAGLARETYHSGRSEDLSHVIAFGKKKFPQFEHIAIGFSLSANALLLLCAGVRAIAMPDKAIAVNGPIHLDKASVKLSQGINLVYNMRFMRQLKDYIQLNRPEDLSRLDHVFDLRVFDEVFTAPLGGFKDRSHYYESCSAKPYLSQIKIPTVILTSKDDPFVSFEDYLEVNLPPHVVLHLENHGGHMGYLSQGIKDYRWLDYALEKYLTAIRDQHE